MPRNFIDAVQGTLDFLVLKALSGGPMHGYGVGRWIRQSSREELVVEEGTLYPALHRLEEQGLLAAEWGVSDTGRRAKYYRLTVDGRRELTERVARWERYAAAVAEVLRSAPAG
jgi:PadR family transcriptional regulator, regulatory protein PadR